MTGPFPPAESHLVLWRRTLARRRRWSPSRRDWCVFRVSEGRATLVSPGATHGMAVGDMVALPAGAGDFQFQGQARVTRLEYFPVSLGSLTGVLTWRERTWLQQWGGGPRPRFRRVAASEAAAVELDRICRGRPAGDSPLLRCELLRIFAIMFSEELCEHPGNPSSFGPAAERIERLLRHWPESMLMNRTTSELARRCGCSERHFNRLFRERCGVSVRRWQIQLRLETAGRLLRESDAKVIHVAMESGYRHLGLFNTMFRRRFGMTPGEWRRREREAAIGPPPRTGGEASVGRTGSAGPTLDGVNGRRAWPPNS